MISLALFAQILAVAMVVMILWLIRRDRLPIGHSLWWLAVSIMIAAFGIFPGLIDSLARKVGISYPPSLLFTLAILTLVIKVLIEDLEVSSNRRRLLRLAQKTAMLEAELEQLKKKVEEQA